MGSYSREGSPIIMGRRCKWSTLHVCSQSFSLINYSLMSFAINFVINGGYGDASEVLNLHFPLYQH